MSEFPKITPRNNDWNRKYGFSDDTGQGFLMELRNGLAYFGWKTAEEETRFYKCEEGVFSKSFALLDGETVSFELDPYENLHFHRYPLER